MQCLSVAGNEDSLQFLTWVIFGEGKENHVSTAKGQKVNKWCNYCSEKHHLKFDICWIYRLSLLLVLFLCGFEMHLLNILLFSLSLLRAVETKLAVSLVQGPVARCTVPAQCVYHFRRRFEMSKMSFQYIADCISGHCYCFMAWNQHHSIHFIQHLKIWFSNNLKPLIKLNRS